MSYEPVLLLVEDNRDDLDLTLLALREVKPACQVVVARDGVGALDYLFAKGKHAGRRKTDTPAMMVLDLKLPRVDGFEVLRRMRADPILRGMVVIVLTSSKEEGDGVDAMRLGTNLYFRKPIDFDETVRLVKSITQLMPAPR